MENLIHIVNKLQDVFNTASYGDSGPGFKLELPQIIVIGIQSAGKSSVLESFVGEPFLPRGTGIVTRIPIILQLVHDKERYYEFEHCKEQRFTDPAKVEQEIQAETDRRAGSNKGIVNSPLRVKVVSPDVVDLTLVDLPGIVKIPVGDQPPDIEQQVKSMLLEYMENPKSIILAVSAGTSDLPTSESIQLAQQIDPTGSRTLAVITQVDLSQKNLTNELNGKVVPVKLGIIGVINRSSQDIKNGLSILDKKREEAAFFKREYPALANRQGSSYLAETLSSILKKHIEKYLPEVEECITKMAVDLNSKMDKLGGDDLLKDKSKILLTVLVNFCAAFKAEIDGKTRHMAVNQLYGQARLSHVFEKIFIQKLSEIDPLEDITDEEILTAIINSGTLQSTLYHPEHAFQALVSIQLRKCEQPSLYCAELVSMEMDRIIRNCFEVERVKQDLTKFPQLRDEIYRVTSEILNGRMQIARDRLREHIDSIASFIKTNDPTFINGVKGIGAALDVTKPGIPGSLLGEGPDGNAANDASPEAMAKNDKLFDIVRKLVSGYFENERKKLQDDVPRILVQTVVYHAENSIGVELPHKLHNVHKTDELIRVSDEVARERNATHFQLLKLKAGKRIIDGIRSGTLNIAGNADEETEDESDESGLSFAMN